MQAADVQVVVTEGEIADALKDRARRQIADLERFAHRDFLRAEIRFTRHRYSETRRPTITHALLDVQGNLVQARTTADHPEESLDVLGGVLEKKLRRLNERLQTRRHEPKWTREGEWRHGALPTPRPDHFPRPLEERETIERVTHARAAATPDEAAFDLEMLEDDWLLYVDADSGKDAVIRALSDDTYELSVAGPSPDLEESAYPITIGKGPAELPLDDAIIRLRDGDEDGIFFIDPETGRGAVVYWRYDGHYGVIRPRDT